MRFLRLVVLCPSLMACATLALTQQHLTDAERDDLEGPVAAVSVTQIHELLKWAQPGGPTLVLPVWCEECEYDLEGNHTRSGQMVNGFFRGQAIRIVYNASGHAVDRFVEDASTGELIRQEVVGPSGITEQTLYQQGMLYWRQTFSYDQYGHTIDWITIDSNGKQIARIHTERDADGHFKEKWGMRKDGKIDFLQTYDAKIEEEHYLSFNQFGGVSLSWSVLEGKLASFWEPPDSPSQFGDNFNEHPSSDTAENYACHHDGKCELSRIHYDYLDPNERNPVSAEWRDADGNLQYVAYYEYEIDTFRNWTYRQVWVWTPELIERKLLENRFSHDHVLAEINRHRECLGNYAVCERNIPISLIDFCSWRTDGAKLCKRLIATVENKKQLAVFILILVWSASGASKAASEVNQAHKTTRPAKGHHQ